MAPTMDKRAIKFHTLGNTLAKEQKYNEAIQNFKKALEIEPNYAAAYYHLAEVYESKKIDDMAYENYVKAIELKNSLATSHIDSGLYTLLSGPLGKAVLEFKKNMDTANGEGEEQPEQPHISGPAEGSPVDLATRPAVEKPRGKKGITPLKVLVDTIDEERDIEVAASEKVTVTVLGDKDIPVAECPVTVIMTNSEQMSDAFIAMKPEMAGAETGPNQLNLKTDNNGCVSVFFKLSKNTGQNNLEIRVEGLAPAFFETVTIPGPVSSVDTHPRDEYYSTGQEVVFQLKAFDRFENPIPSRELAISLQTLKPAGDGWDVEDNQNPVTSEGGVLAQAFTMPRKGHSKCRLLIEDKRAEFQDELHFTVVPGKAASLMFIPGNGEVEPGREFPLKLRLLDEFDNYIGGITAGISLKESSGGEWKVSPPPSETTESDGSITISVTPPDTEDAEAVFEAVSEHLPAGAVNTVKFVTSAAAKDSAGAIESAVEDEFGGEFDNAPGEGSSLGDTIPMDIDVGSDGLSGLPDVEDSETEPKSDSDLVQEPTEGGMSALEGLDFGLDDSGDTSASAPDEQTSEDDFTTPSGDSLSHLDSMLDGGDSKAPEHDDIEPEIPVPPHDAPPYAPEPSAPGDEDTESQSLKLVPTLESTTCRPGDTVPLIVNVTDEFGSPLSAGISVSFRIVEDIGPGGDSFFIDSIGANSGREFTVEPDMSGEASASVQASTRCGSFSVEASSGGNMETIAVNVAPGEPETISIQAAETEVAPGGQIEISARIADAHDNPVPGEFIALSLAEYTGTPGVINEHGNNTTDENGEVRALFTASQDQGDTATITATNPNVASSSVTPLAITVSGAPADTGDTTTPAPPPPDQQPQYDQPQFEQPQFDQPQYDEPVSEPVDTADDQAYQEQYGEGTYDAYPNDPSNEQYDTSAPPPPPAMNAEAPPPPPQMDTDTPPPPPPVPDLPTDFDDDYDDYISEEDEADPYSTPTFEIKQGRKAAVEVGSIMPKIVILSIAGIFLIGLAFAGLFGYKKVMYQYYYTQGVKKFTNSDYIESINFLEKANKMDSSRIEPLEKLAQIRIENAESANKRNDLSTADSEIDKAIKYLDDILLMDPVNIDAMFALGEAYEHKQDFCNSQSQYDRILKLDPKYEAAEAKKKDLRTKCDRMQSLRKGTGRGGGR
ncbi:tetratricopeptide repeat protein [bacterium]